jgi:hypothetical protein
LYAIARVKEDVSTDAAQAELDAISRRLVFRKGDDAGFSDLEWRGIVFICSARSWPRPHAWQASRVEPVAALRHE